MALTAKEIQDKADGIVAPLIDSVVIIQDEWIKTHKGYWQGIRTPQAIPKDGADTPPERDVKPVADVEAASWDQAAVEMPPTLPGSVEVFTHDGPGGKGFTVITYVAFDVQKFVKATGFGKESFSTLGWEEVIEEVKK